MALFNRIVNIVYNLKAFNKIINIAYNLKNNKKIVNSFYNLKVYRSPFYRDVDEITYGRYFCK